MTAVLVGHPLAGFLAEIQVQHTADRIAAQAVGMVFPEPENGVGQQETDCFTPGVVEQERSPLRHFRPAGVCVFIAGCTVEQAQPRFVLGEVGGHPVEDDRDAGLVKPVHQIPKLVGCAVTGSGSVIADYLIAPGTIKGMLHDGHKLHMGIAHLLQVGNQLVSNFSVVQDAAVFAPAPGSQVHLINIHGLTDGFFFLPGFHPRTVVPLIG